MLKSFPINTIDGVKRLFCSGFFMVALLCSYIHVFAQSNKGTEFWTTWTAHVNGATGAQASQMSLYITSDVTTAFKVELADGTLIIADTVRANTVYTPVVSIPISAFMGLTEAGGLNNKKGIHITADKPVAVYAHIYSLNVSGATLLLPVSSLNKDYYSINFTQISNQPASNPAFSTFAVIATEDQTRVRITPTQNIISRTGNINTVTHVAGVAYDVDLQKGDVYQGASDFDLTGTHIESVSTGTGSDCKKIAVFSGASKIQIGTPNRSSDNLFQQVYPTSVWGKNFVTVPLAGRSYDIFRIVYSDPTANVTLNGSPIAPSSTVGNIAYYEFPKVNGSGAANVISSDKPIQVAQYAVTSGNTVTGGNFSEAYGDPEMIFLSPIEQGLKKVTLYSSTYYDIRSHFINVVIPTIALSTFTLDGTVYNGTFTPIAGTPYSYAQISVSAGAHTITASENFNAIAYGFGPVESYGYAAGTNLLNLNEYISLSGLSSTTNQLNGCSGVPYYMQLTVPYQPTKIVWNPDDNTPAVTVNNPAYYKSETLADGTVLYTYRFNRTVTYAAGDYSASATVTLPVVTSSDCGAERRIDFNFYITDFPIAAFTAPAENCANSPVQFTDKSDPAGSLIVKWEWDFGDAANSTASNPNTSTLPSPQHTYIQGGKNYTVTLKVTNENGCESLIKASSPVYINAQPTANFKFDAPYCQGKDVLFTDQSVSLDGTITEWKWDFGDGSTQTLTTNTPFTHQFSNTQTYTVTLQITTSKGCIKVITKTVTVHPVPVADFTLPDACLVDFAKFTNTSTIADGSESLFTYDWDYGDNTTHGITKDGLHKYAAAGDYTVTLKVTSKDGCVFTKSYPFTLNGAFPVPRFTIPTSICSSDDLVIVDGSSVNPGKITRYDIYYDYANHPADFVTYDATHLAIPADKKFIHNYGLSTTTKTYKVKIVIYSGTSASCIAEYPVQDVTVNLNPVITVAQSYVLCQNDSEITLSADKNGFAGTSNFTGGGITDAAAGTFNPKIAGPGSHVIHYIFTLANSPCTYETDINIVVNPNPLVNGKRDYTLQAGEKVTLEPQVLTLDGAKLSYTWSPAQGLSNYTASSPVASPVIDTKYTLTVKSENGCSSTAVFNVKVVQQPIAYNTFTPNGDGVNDTWVIPNMVNFPKATVEVFNRNGEKVFYSIGYPVPWDGRYRGVDLPAGTYYYIIDTKNGKPVQSGPLTIIR